jgi:hypothetical protein
VEPALFLDEIAAGEKSVGQLLNGALRRRSISSIARLCLLSRTFSSAYEPDIFNSVRS